MLLPWAEQVVGPCLLRRTKARAQFPQADAEFGILATTHRPIEATGGLDARPAHGHTRRHERIRSYETGGKLTAEFIYLAFESFAGEGGSTARACVLCERPELAPRVWSRKRRKSI